MVRLIYIVILLFITTNAVAQLDTTRLDTIRAFVHALDTSHYWNYYKANGVIAWRDVKEYNIALIPAGGTAVMGGYVNPYYSIINGFGVIRSDTVGRIKIVTWLDATKKEIKNKWVSPDLIIR
jgi:hypothetical protein